MILYYTGASEYNTPQSEPNKSLGGWISNTKVPNGKKNALFSAIAKQILVDNEFVMRVIALKNTSGLAVTDILIYAVDSADFNIELASVQPSFKVNNIGENEYYAEVLSSENEVPYTGTFYDIKDIGNQRNIGNLDDEAYLILFIKLSPIYTAPTCDQLNLGQGSSLTQLEVNLELSWT